MLIIPIKKAERIAPPTGGVKEVKGSIFMTGEEKRYVANDVIDELNRAITRVLALNVRKKEFVKDYLDCYFADQADEILPGDKEEIENMVFTAVKNSQYPHENIPGVHCKLSLEEILLWTNLCKLDLQVAVRTLFSLLYFMQDNEDERTEKIAQGYRVIAEILEEESR